MPINKLCVFPINKHTQADLYHRMWDSRGISLFFTIIHWQKGCFGTFGFFCAFHLMLLIELNHTGFITTDTSMWHGIAKQYRRKMPFIRYVSKWQNRIENGTKTAWSTTKFRARFKSQFVFRLIQMLTELFELLIDF